MLLNHGLYPLRWKKPKSFKSKIIEKISFNPKGLSMIDMMKLGKLIRNKERSSAEILIEKFNMENNQQRNDTRDWRKSFYRGWFSVASIAVTSISSLEDTSEVKAVFSIRSSSYVCTCMFVMLQQLSFNIYSISNSQIYWHYIGTAFYHYSP